MGKIIFKPTEKKPRHACSFPFAPSREEATFPDDISEEEARRLCNDFPEFFEIADDDKRAGKRSVKATGKRNIEPEVKK